MENVNKTDKLSFAKSLAVEAGKIALKYYRKNKLVKAKTAHELVTNVDVKIQKKIVDKIRKQFPSYSIMSEEMKDDMKKSDFCWCIDPIDGTHNYIFHFPIFGVSIGLAYKGEPYLGAIYFPAINELFYAEKGKGAYWNNKKLIASKHTSQGMLLFDSRSLKVLLKKRNFLKLRNEFFKMRCVGCSTFNIIKIAENLGSAFIALKHRPGDFMAGAIILTESGGKITDFEGNKANIKTKNIIATNGRNHKKIVKLVKQIL